MEELIELRSLIQRGDTQSALLLIDELEEMSKDDYLSDRELQEFSKMPMIVLWTMLD
jgi:hypothetical protein